MAGESLLHCHGHQDVRLHQVVDEKEGGEGAAKNRRKGGGMAKDIKEDPKFFILKK